MNNSSSPFPVQPIFIPRVMDTTISKLNTRLPAIIMDAHHVEWRKGVISNIADLSNVFIIDPVTIHLQYPDARRKLNFAKLPYPKDIYLEDLYSDVSNRLEKIIKPAIQYQLAKNSGIIIAPSFYSEDTDDNKFSLNLTLLSESIRYMEHQQISKPIFAYLCIGKDALSRNIMVNYMVGFYRDEYKDKLTGYFVSINDFDAEKADIDQLLGLSWLVFNLSNGKDVVIKHMGGFGEVLSAIGASGFSSSLDGGEIFSVKNFEERTSGFGRTGGWTYVNEIFDHINDNALKTIGYSCNCPYCAGSIPLTQQNKKLHYLYKRFEAMNLLQPLDRGRRIQLTIDKVRKAMSIVDFYRRKYAVQLSSIYLHKWYDVLENARDWEYEIEENQRELNQLLDELRSEDNDQSSA